VVQSGVGAFMAARFGGPCGRPLLGPRASSGAHQRNKGSTPPSVILSGAKDLCSAQDDSSASVNASGAPPLHPISELAS